MLEDLAAHFKIKTQVSRLNNGTAVKHCDFAGS